MITATGLELRVGPRLLLGDATFRIAPGDRVGLVGRNGAGKTTLTQVLSGESQPAAGQVTRSGTGRLPAAGPAHRRPRRAGPGPDPVRARRWTTSSPGCGPPRARWPAPTRRPHERAMRRYARLEEEFLAAGGYAAESEAAAIASSLGLPERVLEPAAAHALRRPAAPGRAGPDPVLEQPGSDATLLLDEPTNHLDADSIVWLRDYLSDLPGRPGRHQPRRRPAGALRQPGVPPGRQPGRAGRLQRRLEGLPDPAGDRRAAPQAGAGQRREAGLGAQGAGRPDALQGDQGARGAEHGQAGGQAARRAGGGPAQRPGGQAALSPSPRRAARPR